MIENRKYGESFDDFKAYFDDILAECEREAEEQAQMARKPRKYEESDKSTRTVASMIETKTSLLGSLVQSATNSTPAKESKKKEESSPVEELSPDLSDDTKKTNGPRQMRKFEPKSKKNPASPQAKGKAPKKWEDDVDAKSLDYGGEADNSFDLTVNQYESKKDIGQLK